MDPGSTSLNLASIITHHARLSPDRVAVVWENVRLTYGELDKLSNRVANALVEMNIGHGDKVTLICPNLPLFPIVYYGIMKAGAAVVPLNVLFAPREIAYHLADSDAKAVFVFEGTDDLPLAQRTQEAFDGVGTCEHLVVMTKDGGTRTSSSACEISFVPHADKDVRDPSETFQMVPTSPDDTCAILYTSGTTGQPKGAELTHFNIFMNANSAWALHFPAIDFTKDEQPVCLITLPLFHTTGQTAQMNAQLYAGNRVVLLPRFDVDAALNAFRDEGVNFWTGVPTMYWAILKCVEDKGIDVEPYARSMKVLSSGGAPMPVDLMRKFQEKFNVRILEGYGLSETSPITTFNHPTVPSRIGTVGQPLSGVEVMCVDDNDVEVPRGERGEVVIRGHNVMKGYYNRPEATAEAFRNGWFHSGDIGVMDDDGFLSIVDRKKDMILRGGYNIYPRELEEVIITHPAVSLCAVIGVPDERLGEEVKAFVVLNQDQKLSTDDFIAWCKTQFAANKYPRHVEFRENLPIGGTGKIFKRALKEEHSAQ
jgi:long-chain acyl-CoA synthetase